METPDRPATRLVLRAALKEVSPIVARVISVPDSLKIQQFHELFLAMLDWRGDPNFIFRVHGQAFASFRRRYRDTRLDDFRLRPSEKFVYVCDTLDLWEWEVRVLDTEPLSTADDLAPRCLKGRGGAPPELCGGPVGYRLMLRRQQAGPAIADPSTTATTVRLLAASWLARHRSCPHCGRRFVRKASGHRTVSTVYGQVAVPSPRWRCCPCRPGNDRTFRPTARWLTDRTTPDARAHDALAGVVRSR